MTGAKPRRDLPGVYLFIVWFGFNALKLRREVREIFLTSGLGSAQGATEIVDSNI